MQLNFQFTSEYYKVRTVLAAHELECTLNLITFPVPKGSTQERFSWQYVTVNEAVNLHYVNEMADFEGPKGPGNSNLDQCFTYFKLFRLHAIFHDAFGFMESNNVRPVCVYALSETIFVNCVFLGHITGVADWFHMKVFKSSDYEK